MPSRILEILRSDKPTAPKRQFHDGEMHSILGLINYSGRFVRSLSMILAPLYNLLKAETVWNCSQECGRAFSITKQFLTLAEGLLPFNQNLRICLVTDA